MRPNQRNTSCEVVWHILHSQITLKLIRSHLFVLQLCVFNVILWTLNTEHAFILDFNVSQLTYFNCFSAKHLCMGTTMRSICLVFHIYRSMSRSTQFGKIHLFGEKKSNCLHGNANKTLIFQLIPRAVTNCQCFFAKASISITAFMYRSVCAIGFFFQYQIHMYIAHAYR